MLVHKYFIKPLDEDSELAAIDQIELGHEYFNRIVQANELWKEYRRASRDFENYRELRLRAVREDRKHFVSLGLHFGSYWLIEAAAKKAKHPHRRNEWDEGRAGVPIPTSGTSKGVLCDDPHRTVFDISGSVVSLRIGSRQTRWSLHRRQFAECPLPPGGLIVQAWVQRERVSTRLLRNPRYRWFLILVIDRVSPRQFFVDSPRSAIGLDLGWSRAGLAEQTLRIAYIANEDLHRPLLMLPEHFSAFKFADSLKTIADRECAEPLKEQLGLKPKTGHLKLVRQAPEDVRVKQLIHLMEWNKGASCNTLAARNAHYLKMIQELCRAHHTIYIEKIKGSPELVGRKKSQTKKNRDGGRKRGQRQLAAPFTFLRRLQAEAPKFNTMIVEVDHAFTSRICTCGSDLGPGGERERCCGSCGQVWDRDHLAALNLLKKGTARIPACDAAE